MSQLGDTITIDDLPTGHSWALIAHTAINHSGDYGTGAGGIMAASSDIEALILAGDIASLYIFPQSEVPAGLYLWHGVIEEDGALIGTATRLHPYGMQHWLDNNGTAP
jgi:hypothetical protein